MIDLVWFLDWRLGYDLTYRIGILRALIMVAGLGWLYMI